MKEFDFPFIGIFTGLRRDKTNKAKPGLVECHNVYFRNQVPHVHEYINDLYEAVSFDGAGQLSAPSTTRSITIYVADYVDLADLSGVTVYIDDVSKGTTGADGTLTVDDVEVGGHALKLTKTGYDDSDDDELSNDFIMVI